MGDEPETALRFQCGVSLKCGCCAMSPFVDLASEKSVPEGRALGGRGAKPAAVFFSVLRKKIRGGGKVGNLLLVFHFSIALVAGAVEMWESRLPFGGISKGARGKSGKPAFGFPRFPQPRHFHSALASSCGPAASQQAHLGFLHPPRGLGVAQRFGLPFQHPCGNSLFQVSCPSF
jgi:hypothetical protein